MATSSLVPLDRAHGPGWITARLAVAGVVLAGAALAWGWLGRGEAPPPATAVATHSAALPPAPTAAVPLTAAISQQPAHTVLPPPASPPAARPSVVAAAAPPVRPVLPARPPPPVPPSFDIVRVAPHGETVLAGRSTPGARIVVAANGHPIAHTQADAAGQWVALPAAPLPPGGQTLSLATIPAHPSEPALTSAAPVLVLVPPAPRSATPAGAAPGALAVLLPPQGMPSLLQAPAPAVGAAQGRSLGLGIVDYDAKGAIRFAGTAPPTSTVRVYVDRRPAGVAVADAAGHWTLSPTVPVGAGQHGLRVDQLAAAGGVSARIALPFERVVVSEADLTGRHLIVQPGQNLWRIARSVYGQGIRYTVIYVANRGQIRDPNLIYPGQVFALPAAAAATAAPAAGAAPAAAITSR